jgi:molybdenum cofactor cytidylyltransferase
MIAFVLAAGAGERMGGPKGLLIIDGESLAEGHVKRALEAGCDEVIVATRPELVPALTRAYAIADARVHVIVSRAPDPAGTLAVAVRYINAPPRALRPYASTDGLAMIAPVDTLPASVATIHALRNAVTSGADAATPRHAGRGGHPVVCKMHVLGAYAQREDPPPLRDVLSALGDRRVRIDVDDPRIAIDLDSPEDVVRVTSLKPVWTPK